MRNGSYANGESCYKGTILKNIYTRPFYGHFPLIHLLSSMFKQIQQYRLFETLKGKY